MLHPLWPVLLPGRHAGPRLQWPASPLRTDPLTQRQAASYRFGHCPWSARAIDGKESAMRVGIGSAVLALAIAVGATGVAQGAANDEAPCIGENASTFAPLLRREFGQIIVAPEAQAGLTGEVASTAARTECR